LSRKGYNSIVADHFENPRNVGTLRDADGIGIAGDASCGDVMTIWIRVRNERISEIAFQCQGCPAAIACGSVTTELAKGMNLDEAAQIVEETISRALGGLPPAKRRCSNLGAEALSNAIWDYVFRSVEAAAGRQGSDGPAGERIAGR